MVGGDAFLRVRVEPGPRAGGSRLPGRALRAHRRRRRRLRERTLARRWPSTRTGSAAERAPKAPTRLRRPNGGRSPATAPTSGTTTGSTGWPPPLPRSWTGRRRARSADWTVPAAGRRCPGRGAGRARPPAAALAGAVAGPGRWCGGADRARRLAPADRGRGRGVHAGRPGGHGHLARGRARRAGRRRPPVLPRRGPRPGHRLRGGRPAWPAGAATPGRSPWGRRSSCRLWIGLRWGVLTHAVLPTSTGEAAQRAAVAAAVGAVIGALALGGRALLAPPGPGPGRARAAEHRSVRPARALSRPAAATLSDTGRPGPAGPDGQRGSAARDAQFVI